MFQNQQFSNNFNFRGNNNNLGRSINVNNNNNSTLSFILNNKLVNLDNLQIS